MLIPGVAQLAAATSDGAIYILPVTRNADPESGTWDLTVGSLQTVLTADKRAVNTIKWIKVGTGRDNADAQDDALVWTKPGTVSSWSMAWDAPKTVRLERVGNWAGCNALGQAIGECTLHALLTHRHPLCRPTHSSYRTI